MIKIKLFSIRNIVLPILMVSAIACSQPQEISYVNDYADVLTVEQETELTALYIKHQEVTTNQIVLVTTNDLGDESSVKDYAVSFANNYGVGQKGKDNGIVIAIDMQNNDLFIATGYGMEIIYEDHEVKAVIDNNFIPKFQEGEFFQGLIDGSKAIIKHLELPENMVFIEK